MNIKVCGITDLKQLQQLDGLDIDYAGLIFYEQSPRYIRNKLKPEDVKKADFDLKKVGVFVDASLSEVLDAIDDYGLDVVQLHGNESAELCDDLSTEVEVIKAFRINEESDINEIIAPFDAVCDFYLFDSKPPTQETFGGSGNQYDWNILNKAKIEKPFFLSGGIRPDDGHRLKAFRHPDFFGVDINSKFETAPGVKDMKLLLQFKQSLK